jgi:hypothetical protein
MNAPYSNISMVAGAAGAIQGITRNLLGGPDSIFEAVFKGGMLGELEHFIKEGNTERALTALKTIHSQVSSIQTNVNDIR